MSLRCMIGLNVIVRTPSARVWFGKLSEKDGNEVILKNARYMHEWWASKSIGLSGCAVYGIRHDHSRICPPVDVVWLNAIEILPVAPEAAESIYGAEEAKARLAKAERAHGSTARNDKRS